MPRKLTLTVAATIGAATCSFALFAHDDDGKLRDRLPPYAGRGLRTGAPRVGAPTGGQNSALMNFGNYNVRLMSWLTLPDLGGGNNGNSLFGYTSPSGREYAVFGSYTGTHFVEVTDPGNPVIVGFVGGPNSLWRDVRTYQSYAYAVSEGGGGIQVMDLSQIDNGSVALVNSVTTGGTTATHSMTIDETSGFLYRAGGGSNGIRIYDLATPSTPTFVAQWQDHYVHEPTVITYTSGPYAGKQIAFLCGGYNGGTSGPGVDIVDVTNKGGLVNVSHIGYSNAGYSHQAWPTPDMHYLYLDDEFDESNFGIPTRTIIFDISNLSALVELPSFTNGNSAIGHNLYTRPNRIYEANYTSGLRVFDSTNPLAPVEIAYFDTRPENDAASYNGLWNVYPYFASGTVIGSDIERGLFVWWVGAPLVDISLPGGTPSTIAPLGATAAVDITELNPGDYAPGTAMLHYNLGAGWSSSPLVALGGTSFEAHLPPIPCGTAAQWYISAQSTNGFTWTEPEGAPNDLIVSTSALSVTQLASHDFETSAAWVAGAVGDNATAGTWTLGNPAVTHGQSEDDHSVVGYQCWYTGASADVDGGQTTLLSTSYSLSSASEPYIRYWRWYSNSSGTNPGSDTFQVDISNNNGSSWTPVETVGPSGEEASGGWFVHQFRVADFVAPTNQIRLRFVARDLGGDSAIEAAIDDFQVLDVTCTQAPVVYCSAKLNSHGCLGAIAFSGTASATSSSPFAITASNVLNQKFGVLFYGTASANVPFQGGTLCVQTPVVRTPLQNSAGNPLPDDCSGAYTYDFNARIQSAIDPNLVAGATLYSQYWYRDGVDPLGFGTALTNALQFTIGL